MTTLKKYEAECKMNNGDVFTVSINGDSLSDAYTTIHGYILGKGPYAIKAKGTDGAVYIVAINISSFTLKEA